MTVLASALVAVLPAWRATGARPWLETLLRLLPDLIDGRRVRVDRLGPLGLTQAEPAAVGRRETPTGPSGLGRGMR